MAIDDQALLAHRQWLEDPTSGERLVRSDADLRGARLRGADLRGVRFERCDLRHIAAPLSAWDSAELVACDLRSASFSGASMTGAELSKNRGEGADLSLVDLSHANLGDNRFQDAVFERATLAGAITRGGFFDRADLREVVWDGALFEHVSFEDADLSHDPAWRGAGGTAAGTIFRECDLTHANFDGTDWSETTFDACATSPNVSNVNIDPLLARVVRADGTREALYYRDPGTGTAPAGAIALSPESWERQLEWMRDEYPAPHFQIVVGPVDAAAERPPDGMVRITAGVVYTGLEGPLADALAGELAETPDEADVLRARLSPFVDESARQTGDFWIDRRARTATTLEQAREYAAALGKRLPTRAEWVRAARGMSMQLFPWGDEHEEDGGPSATGCEDMLGGPEWCEEGLILGAALEPFPPMIPFAMRPEADAVAGFRCVLEVDD